MTTQEFSNTFDTLLNSYASQAFFGEQASQSEIVLDEYEKSVLLTQAQDIILKQYFQRTSAGEGFDDSARRQTDFSSLITSEDCEAGDAITTPYAPYDDRSLIYKVPVNNDTDTETSVTKVLLILNEKLCIRETTVTQHYNNGSTSGDPVTVGPKIVKQCVVIPINYKEYDRQMSKAFSQPLKKQAWRLIQDNAASNEASDLYMEVIPTDAFSSFKNVTEIIKNVTVTDPVSGDPLTYDKVTVTRTFVYRMRYLRRPKPIILTDLNQDYQEDLDIDGYKEVSECELNPILHMDILTKAVELAMSTRGVRQQPKAAKE